MNVKDFQPTLARIRSSSSWIWVLFVGFFTGFFLGDTQFASADEPSKEEGIAFYEKHIRPLFAKHCYSCHSAKAADLQGELRLDIPEGWNSEGANGPRVIPGAPEASSLIQAIQSTDANKKMPPSGSLSKEEIEKLVLWIRMGAPGPQDGLMHRIDDPSDPIAGKEHWAFQKLEPSAPSSIAREETEREWATSQLDRYILAELQEASLSPVADAKPLDFLRRLSFQLTGLPPSEDDVRDYLAAGLEPGEVSESKKEKLVDRLLASPQFGKRWGRHWLDLARYADSNGLDENFLFREAWRYRNWVIDAINEDMPFDRFVLEQIAGDLLPYDTIEQRDRQRIASGFLVIGPKVLLGNNAMNQKMEVADEQLDTIGKALWGQSLGCARCHDHKFDPIPTRDYYAMAGIFASTSVMEMRYMLGEQRLMERLVGLGEHGNVADDEYEQYWRSMPQRRKTAKEAEEALALLRRSQEEALALIAEKNEEALSPIAKDMTLPHADRVLAQESFVKDCKSAIAKPPSIPPRGMISQDIEAPADEAIRIAGQFDRMGAVVPRGVLQVLQEDKPWIIEEKRSGRVEFGRWLMDGESASSRLVARVLANRIWYQLFGSGLVRTVDNFGRTGEVASHPELLDYLAQRLIDSGWSTKSLVREIVMSKTFALSTEFQSDNHARDPDNRKYWRMNRRRLEPEAYRDAMLEVAGLLDISSTGSTVSYLGDQATAVGENKVRRKTDIPFRSIYLPVIRNDLPEIFDAFDFANPHQATGSRPNTVVPNQALFAMNDPLMLATSKSMAERLFLVHPNDGIEEKTEHLFEWVFHQRPTAGERDAIQVFVEEFESSNKSESTNSEKKSQHDELEAWTLVCHALLASSRFQYLE